MKNQFKEKTGLEPWAPASDTFIAEPHFSAAPETSGGLFTFRTFPDRCF